MCATIASCAQAANDERAEITFFQAALTDQFDTGVTKCLPIIWKIHSIDLGRVHQPLNVGFQAKNR